jgi:hypothetical protein
VAREQEREAMTAPAPSLLSKRICSRAMPKPTASIVTVGRWTSERHSIGLVKPLNDALDYTGIRTLFRQYVLLFFLREMAERRRAFWGWTTDEWIETIERHKKVEYQHVIAVAYLLCGFSDLHRPARTISFMLSWPARFLAAST